MLKPTYTLPTLPPPVNLDTVPVLKALAKANWALAELKAAVIPNQAILIDTLSLQEAKASSEIEIDDAYAVLVRFHAQKI